MTNMETNEVVEAPKLMVVLFTYADKPKGDRSGYAERTLRSALDHIRYSGQLSVHIADDGSVKGHVERLEKLAGGYPNVHGVSSTNSQRRGYGANFNVASQVTHAHSEVILCLEDDWVLEEDLPLDPYVKALYPQPDEVPVGCIRLGYIGFTQELRGILAHIQGTTFLVFDTNSPEPHVFAGHPRLERYDWQRMVGPWPEGLDPGSTEFAVAQNPAARRGVAWPMDTPRGGWFRHIGTVQARTDQGGAS